MIRLARLSIAHPVRALAVWGAVAIALAVIGIGVSDRLSPSVVVVPGTSSAHAQHLADAKFGASVLVPVLLEGPKSALDHQGPIVVRRLRAERDIRVLSAWDGGSTGKELRPKPGAAMIVAAVARTEKHMVKGRQAEVEGIVDRAVAAPVHAHVTGQAAIDVALKDAALDATRRAELLPAAILFGVLLLVLRAPVAAVVLAAFGAVTSLASFGAMALLGRVIAVDPTAVALASMTGLALGVGYGLLVYRRSLEEEWRADTAVATTGRAVLIGGTALTASLALAPLIAPTEILTSLGIGVLLCSMLGIGAAVVVMPAVVTLLGARLQAGSFPAPAPLRRAWERVAGRGGGWVVRNAVGAGAVATAALVMLALPAASIETGPPSAKLLPASSAARTNFEEVARVMGPGWPTPFNVVVASTTKPITDRALLIELDRFQAAVAKDPRVASVVGPGAIRATSTDLAVLPRKLRESTKLLKGGKRDLGRLEKGLGQAHTGATQLRAGLVSAAGGAGQIHAGSQAAGSGAGQLRAGLDRARAGAGQVSGGLQQALAAARKLRDGAGAALAGSRQITGGLGDAVAPVKSGAPIVRQMAGDVGSGAQAIDGATSSAAALATQLDAALSQMQAMKTGTDDPGYQAAVGALSNARGTAQSLQNTLGGAAPKVDSAASVASAFADQVAKLSTGLQQLYAGSSQLTNGIAQLQNGNGQLADGIGKLSAGGGQLTGGVSALRDGAAQLEAGLAQLSSGSGELAGGLEAGTGPTGELAGGLNKLHSGVAQFRSGLPSPEDLERLQRQSPGLFDSGYFVLAALAGASATERETASFAVNLERGGTAGQITIVPRSDISSTATRALGVDLQRRVDAFAARTHTEAAVGGPAGQLGDFTDETLASIWPVVLVLAGAVALLLMALLRAVVLPLIAVAFDLLAVAATFGALWLLFGGDDPVLGGPGYLDPMSIVGIFAAIFGLTMVYEVVLLQRTREELEATRDPVGAIRTGLRATAGPATGAALVMIAAVLPFAATNVLTIRQFGLGVAIAVLIDALIVRPVLLPAAMAAIGGRGWWPARLGQPRPTTDRMRWLPRWRRTA